MKELKGNWVRNDSPHGLLINHNFSDRDNCKSIKIVHHFQFHKQFFLPLLNHKVLLTSVWYTIAILSKRWVTDGKSDSEKIIRMGKTFVRNLIFNEMFIIFFLF